MPTKVHLVKAIVFPVVMYGYESWTVKKAERRRIDAFELWCWSFQVKYKYSTGCIYTKTLFVVYLKFKITWMLHIFICQFYQASLEGLTSVSRCQSLKMECKLICQISFLLKEVFFFFPLKGEVNVWANCEQKKSQGNDLQE